jgi:hypothetical protein
MRRAILLSFVVQSVVTARRIAVQSLVPAAGGSKDYTPDCRSLDKDGKSGREGHRVLAS